MIQTSFFPQPEKDIMNRGSPGRRHFSLFYKTRYIHPKTGEVLKGSAYLDGKKRKTGRTEYFYNNKWVKPIDVPENRERRRIRESTLNFFMSRFKMSMVYTNKKWIKRNREIIGVNEFTDKWNCCDKIRAHFDEQVAKYGYKCPITHIDFTTIKKNKKIEKFEGVPRIISNISIDRLLNHINYTKKNVLFTSQGWNVARLNFSLPEIEQLFPVEFVDRYKKILIERFPDQACKDV